MLKKLYIVVPCYNEEEVLPETSKRLGAKLQMLIRDEIVDKDSRIMFVDDGSKDKTWQLIEEYHNENPIFTGLKLSRNKGHQNALLAGLMTAKELCDVTISIDADLQDDIEAIDLMLDEYSKGSEIVYGVRSSRKKDTLLKRTTAEGFYKTMRLLGVETVFNHADYRLMSKKAVEGLAEFKEVNLFLRGIVPMIGFKSEVVYYARDKRFAGESKYPIRKMISFALEGITSLSSRPIRIITLIGFLIFIMSMIMIAYFIFRWAIGATVSGWASVICSVWAIGGLIMLSLGVIGEYIGKIYIETKERPKYIIDKILEEKE